MKLVGHGTDKDEEMPKKVEALADEIIIAVTCGKYYTCAITSTGSIVFFTWGSRYFI